MFRIISLSIIRSLALYKQQ